MSSKLNQYFILPSIIKIGEIINNGLRKKKLYK